MKYKKAYFIGLLSSAVLFSACYKNPVTGRKSLNLVDEGTMNGLASQQYGTFITTNKPVHGTKDAEMVQRVGTKLAAAVQQYLSQQGQLNLVQGYKWEFNLVNNGEANAWCMPGGKVVVYSGIMPIVQNETALAVVLGHEIAHAIARHGNERMSQQLVVESGGQVLSAALASEPAQTQNIFNEVYGVTGQLGVLLPYSRKHESEADHMGLIFMALAGYNPNEAVNFWQRMAAQNTAKPPVFMSTHPADEKRIQQIKAWMPEALKYYKR